MGASAAAPMEDDLLMGWPACAEDVDQTGCWLGEQWTGPHMESTVHTAALLHAQNADGFHWLGLVLVAQQPRPCGGGLTAGHDGGGGGGGRGGLPACSA